MTNDDLEAVVHPGLSGVCLAKCGGPDNVQRLDWKLEELERRRNLPVGSVAIQLFIETAKGVINAYPSAIASKRVNSLIFGAVDYTKDMRVKLTRRGKSRNTPAGTRRWPPGRRDASPSIVPSWPSRIRRLSRRAPAKAGRWGTRGGC